MDIWFVLLHISTFFIIFLLLNILKIYKKNQIHIAFILLNLCLFLWSIGRLLESYFEIFTGKIFVEFAYVYFSAIILLPLCVLFTGLVVVGKKISCKYFWFIVPQVISLAVLLTNHTHNMFYVLNTKYNSSSVYGLYFYLHSIISYVYILIGIYFITYFSVRNSGFFSKNTFIILIGMIPAILVNVIGTLNIVGMHFNLTPICFAFTVLCFYVAIVKFEFFNLVPLAMQNIVNEISDCFIVVDTANKIIDYNEPFQKVFGSIVNMKRNIRLTEVKSNYDKGDVYIQMLMGYVKKSRYEKKTFFVHRHFEIGDIFDKYFSIDVTPIIKKDSYKGTIIFFKDITELKNAQSQLIAKEKLASLGQLTGGLAHSLKTPISSMGDSLELLNEYVKEYDDSIDEVSVTKEDHHEIAKDMKKSLVEMHTIIKYMSEVIKTVKNYSTDADIGFGDKFTIKELKDTILVLLNHELKRHSCKLNVNLDVDDNIVIKGDMRNMIQVINVLISNAIEAYANKANGIVEFSVNLDSQKNIVIAVKDYGRGIPVDIQNKLFNRMCTTKGNKGTGIGLYISRNIIEAQFNGKLTFESEEGKGSTFYITIPGKYI